jgi:hypothetical protein
MKRLFLIFSAVLLLFNGLSALFGGWQLMLQPDGSSMQMSLDWLQYSPFSNYLIPGILLFVVNGLMSILVFILLIIKYKSYPLLVMLQGVLLFGWIAVQVLLLRDIIWIQILYGSIGLVLLLLGWLLRKKK